jgi:predicted transcriptional regulator
MFSKYLKEGLAKKVSIDKELAKSLLKVARFRLEKAKKEKPADENAFFIVENCYEALKELIDAIMSLDGYKSYSHEACIDFLKEFYAKQLGTSAIFTVDRYRKLRHDIKYRGILPSLEEGRNAVADIEPIFALLETIIRQKTGR